MGSACSNSGWIEWKASTASWKAVNGISARAIVSVVLLKADQAYITDANETNYHCEKINCACIPGRFLCGEDGSVSKSKSFAASGHKLIADIDEFLDQEVKGPGSFSCVSGKGCKFSEPAMNGLINDVFGDPAITLDCDSGECLHYTQVPGYTRPIAPDNSRWVALSAALAALIFVAACLRKLFTLRAV